jgi:hypothetical protein
MVPELNLDVEPTNVINEILREREFEMQVQARDELFANRDQLLDAVMEQLRTRHRIREGVHNGKPVHETLRERLTALPHAEFILAAGLILGEDAAIGFWCRAVCPLEETAEDGEETDETPAAPAVVNIR